MNWSMKSVPAKKNTVNSTHKQKVAAMVVSTARWSRPWSLAPKHFPMITVAPMENPLKKKTDMLVIMVVELTAARAWVPTKFPTTMESTVLYSIWKIFPIIRGRANSRISRGMLPEVMSLVVVRTMGIPAFRWFGIDNIYYTIEKGAVAQATAPSYVSPNSR